MLHHQSDAYDKFEEISALVKRTHLSFKDPKRDFEVNAAAGARSADEVERHRWIQKSCNLLNEINDLAQAQDQKELIKKQPFAMPNFLEEAEMLEWAGVSFGEADTYRLSKSIKRLAVMSGAERIRFAGKILGSQKDYWIVSGVLQEPEENGQDSSIEKRGTGANQLVFWVTDNLLNDWIQLPDVQPRHIEFARCIKHVMTGDLNAEIDANPGFPGKERHFLRAQLARIFAATTIAPKGLFETDEETGLMKFAEEFAMPGTEELKSLESWSNVSESLLRNGRTKYVAPEGLDDEAKEAWITEKAEADPQIERFRTINEHQPLAGLETAWISKTAGDTQQYTKGDGSVCYAVNVIKSIRWPGAVTVCKNGKFTNVYVGYGVKRVDPSFNPTVPPNVDSEPSDPVEQSEPNPEKEPEVKPVENAEGEEPAEDE